MPAVEFLPIFFAAVPAVMVPNLAVAYCGYNPQTF